MTRCLGCNHNYVEISAGYDLVVMDTEAVGKSKYRTLFEVGFNFRLVKLRLEFVRCQDHNKIRTGNRFRNIFYSKTRFFGLGS